MAERSLPQSGGVFAVASDLCRGGCTLLAPAPLGAGTALNVHLSLDSDVVEAEGRVVRETLRPDGRYDLGVEFTRMDPVHRARFNLRVPEKPAETSPSRPDPAG
jgi:hypothetical protein